MSSNHLKFTQNICADVILSVRTAVGVIFLKNVLLSLVIFFLTKERVGTSKNCRATEDSSFLNCG